jgi:mono/diheme cytochrome c family protein
VSGKQFSLLLLLLVGWVLSACGALGEAPLEDKQSRDDGQMLYVEYCSECHQTEGQGWSTLYPRLAGNPIVTLHDPVPIIVTVKYGQGSMMPFGDRLTNEEIAAILTYIRNSWGNEASPVHPKQVN